MTPGELALLPKGDWEEVLRDFRWEIPEDFSIAESCCDRWARFDPDRAAIIDVDAKGEKSVWSFGRLKSESDALAATLRASGVVRGDRVGILLSQRPEVMVAHFAAHKLGAVSLPLFTLFGADALEYRLADSGASAVVTDAEQLEKLLSVAGATSVETVVALDAEGPQSSRPEVIRWDAAVSAAPLAMPEPVGPDDPAVMIYTSGTTGAPKGALHGHRFLLGHLPSVEMVLERPREGDVAWTPADWAWIGGLMDLAMPALYFGLPLVSHRMRKFGAEAAYALMCNLGVSISFLPPTALKLMRGTPVPEGMRLRAIGSGGESLGADLLAWAEETLGAGINELYGQTECNLVVSSSRELGVGKPGTMGKAVPGHEVAVLGRDGVRLPAGEVGEICVKAPDPVMFLGYWNKPEKTAEKFRDGWLLTGDLGSVDDDGYLTYSSRDDDVITSAGYRIGPTEIENCLSGDEDVVMAACVGVPDDVRGEIVKAFVVLREGASEEGAEERLIARVKARVSPHVAPRAMTFVEDLPKTATGKIMRRTLRGEG